MSKKVYVLGEINVDLIMTGEDVTPEWNREKLVDSFDVAMGSSSVISACGLAGLGLKVYFVGIVGDDEFGHFMIRGLQKAGVNTDGVIVDATQKTGVTFIPLYLQRPRSAYLYGFDSEFGAFDVPFRSAGESGSHPLRLLLSATTDAAVLEGMVSAGARGRRQHFLRYRLGSRSEVA